MYFVEGISITDITSDSAEVSWTVSFISTQKEYVVDYGQDEDSLDEASESLSVSDTGLIDQMYNVTLSGLTQDTVYYVRVATTNAENVTFYSDIESFRTLQPGNKWTLGLDTQTHVTNIDSTVYVVSLILYVQRL